MPTTSSAPEVAGAPTPNVPPGAAQKAKPRDSGAQEAAARPAEAKLGGLGLRGTGAGGGDFTLGLGGIGTKGPGGGSASNGAGGSLSGSSTLGTLQGQGSASLGGKAARSVASSSPTGAEPPSSAVGEGSKDSRVNPFVTAEEDPLSTFAVDVDTASYTLARRMVLGYENRDIADRDFRNDRVDAGEIGSGHTVTALYELELKPGAGEGLATVRVRAKRPRGESTTERAYRFPTRALASTFKEASADLRFATAVMGAAELLRRSPHADRWSFDRVRDIARASTPAGNAEREEFLSLLEEVEPLLRAVAER